MLLYIYLSGVAVSIILQVYWEYTTIIGRLRTYTYLNLLEAAFRILVLAFFSWLVLIAGGMLVISDYLKKKLDTPIWK